MTYSLLSLPLARHGLRARLLYVGIAFSVRVFQAAPDVFLVYSVESTHPATILIPLFQYSLAGAASDSARLCLDFFVFRDFLDEACAAFDQLSFLVLLVVCQAYLILLHKEAVNVFFA